MDAGTVIRVRLQRRTSMAYFTVYRTVYDRYGICTVSLIRTGGVV